MTLIRSEKDGGLYGTAPVILSREKNLEVEYYIGSSSPFGGIALSEEYDGKKFREEPRSWWENEGFTVTEAPELEEARRLSAERSRAKVGLR